MRSIALALTLLALVLAGTAQAATATAAAAPKRDRCAPRAGERVEARTATAVALTQAAATLRLIGCARASGRRRVVAPLPAGLPSLDTVRMRGTELGYRISGHDPVIDDAVHRVRSRVLRSTRDYNDVTVFALGPRGAVAWYEGSMVTADVLLSVPGDVTRLLDEGADMTGLAFTGGALTWRHSGHPRRTPLAPRDRCPARARVGGNVLVDLLRTPLGTAVCLRASGVVTDLAEAAPRDVVLAGTWAAAWAGSRLLTADAAAGERRTLVTAGTPGPLTVDEHGSVAWAEVTEAPAHTIVRAIDAAGTRIAWEGDVAVLFLRHDRSTVLFARDWDPIPFFIDVALTP
ncbi:hypothetical protein [Conexibacter woesei]|uniref:hypothetical protein n=1 Tax=Conexibacter woesei TaxID=191495 RepID=UPI00040E9799|nr:hypothetical protein [Conexibacter woesei]